MTRYDDSNDIMKKGNLENRWQQGEERISRIFQSTPLGIIVTDVEGNYLEVNEAQCKLSRATRMELITQNYFNQRDMSLQPHFLRALQGESSEHEGWYTTTARGLTYWVRTVFAPLYDSNGQVDGVIIVSEDKTDKKKLEDRLLEQERLTSMGTVVAMVGHDLRSPLQAMANSLYLAKRAYDSAPPECREAEEMKKLSSHLETVKQQAEYMSKIVLELQEYAKPLGPRREETDLSRLLNDTLSSIEIPANIDVALVLPPDSPKTWIDPVMVRRILANLITNAVQAMPAGGRLTIESSFADDGVSISVRDTGVGITEENKRKLFRSPFTTKTGGTGLGLAICKRIVDAHGGSIIVESNVGEGSTFTVKMPLMKEIICSGQEQCIRDR